MIKNQAYIFLIFVINGLIIGFMFDIFRVLRISFKTKNFVTYIEDIIFWILTGLLILSSVFVFNDGEIRLFMFLGIAIGTIIYLMIFSKHIIEFLVSIIKKLKIVITGLFKIIILPFNFIRKILRKIFLKPISFITVNIRKGIKNTKLTLEKSLRRKVKNN